MYRHVYEYVSPKHEGSSSRLGQMPHAGHHLIHFHHAKKLYQGIGALRAFRTLSQQLAPPRLWVKMHTFLTVTIHSLAAYTLIPDELLLTHHNIYMLTWV